MNFDWKFSNRHVLKILLHKACLKTISFSTSVCVIGVEWNQNEFSLLMDVYHHTFTEVNELCSSLCTLNE